MLTIWALAGIPEICPGMHLPEIVMSALQAEGSALHDGDILVVTSKIVSKAEGRTVAVADREAAVAAETVRVVASRNGPDGAPALRIVENRLGIVGASAGVDGSNTPEGTVLLLPEDPDRSARELAQNLRAEGPRVGVIVSDTLGRPWRDGQTDIAIGAAGVRVFDDHVGLEDAQGRSLRVTRPCVADELAAAADLVKGKVRGLPVAVVRGAGHLVGGLDLPGARSIPRSPDRDMFREGSDEAYARGVAAGLASRPGEG